MPKVDWPPAPKRIHIGRRIDRVDGPVKVAGAAKYSFDINRPGMLYAKLVVSPYGKAKVVKVDPSPAKALPGVEVVWVDEDLEQVQYAGQIVAAVAARTEEIAGEAVRLVKVEYERQPHQVVDDDVALFDSAKDRPARRDEGNVDEAFGKADKIVEGEYGIPVITHCCLEPHGQVAEVRDGEMFNWPSTQAVSGYADRSISDEVEIPQNQYPRRLPVYGRAVSDRSSIPANGRHLLDPRKAVSRPVKLMLDRDLGTHDCGQPALVVRENEGGRH